MLTRMAHFRRVPNNGLDALKSLLPTSYNSASTCNNPIEVCLSLKVDIWSIQFPSQVIKKGQLLLISNETTYHSHKVHIIIKPRGTREFPSILILLLLYTISCIHTRTAFLTKIEKVHLLIVLAYFQSKRHIEKQKI